MKTLLALALFVLPCCEVFASGGAVAVVRRPILFPRVAIRRAVVAPQAVVVAPQAIIAQPIIRQRFVTPLVVPQAYIQPQAFFQQQYVVPQVQSFSTGNCASAAFFSY